jgi:hypothetical protein
MSNNRTYILPINSLVSQFNDYYNRLAKLQPVYKTWQLASALPQLFIPMPVASPTVAAAAMLYP